MGAISGDVNTSPMRCVDAADLTSRPTASKSNGDMAYVTAFEAGAHGPYFFFNRDLSLSPSPGLIIPAGGGGVWLSLPAFGTPAVASPVATDEFSAPIVVAPGDTVVIASAALPAAPFTGRIDVDGFVSGVQSGFVTDDTAVELFMFFRAVVNGGVPVDISPQYQESVYASPAVVRLTAQVGGIANYSATIGQQVTIQMVVAPTGAASLSLNPGSLRARLVPS